MGIKSLAEIGHLFKELAEFKKKAPEIKSLFEYFDKSENPKESLEKILEAVKRNPVTDDLLKISQTYNMVLRAEKNACEKGWNYACLESVKEMGVKIEIIGEENIPLKGPTLYVSNHPYGLLDSAVLIGGLGSLLEKKGEKMKVIGMNQLKFIKGIEEVVYFVNSTGAGSNLSVLKDSLEYLENGGNLAIYPSGIMSGPKLKEYPWKNEIASFIPHSSYVVPIWFSGPDHEKIYNFLARYEKTENLRRVFSFRGTWNKQGKTIYLKIGNPLPSEWLMDEFKDGKERIVYLRRCAENLKVDI
ncbi:MAG: 1-acyl-sn-glycerol-3-phosphate acyltransferase [Candidatus Diapherotrites archaeon]